MKRRAFISGALASPLIVKTPGLLMPVRKIIQPEPFELVDDCRTGTSDMAKYMARLFLEKYEQNKIKLGIDA